MNKIKTNLVTLIFIISTIYNLYNIYSFKTSLPIIIFYIILIINTYFSINFFSKIIPKNILSQNIVDIILFTLYILLSFSFNVPIMFVFMACIFFTIATIKYVLLLGNMNHEKVLKKKIMIDSLGIILMQIVLGLIITNYQTFGLWFLVIVFAISNFYLLLLKPMYSIHEPK